MTSLRGVLAIAVALATVAVTVGAAEGPDEKQRVRALYEQATKDYNLGRFDDALRLYTQAYEIRADPAFLFNIAQCYRQLHRPAEAAREYRAYLREAPDAPNRAEVQQRIKDLDEETARQEAAKPPAGTQPPAGDTAATPRADLVATAPAEQPRSRTWLWITIGAAAAVVVAAVALGLAFGLSSSSGPPSSTLGTYGVLP